MATFNPDKDIPDLKGKVILVTGGTAGIGKFTVLLLASHNPAQIYFTGRNTESANKLIAEAKTRAPQTPVTFIPCDLSSSRDTIRQALVGHFKSTRLDIFIANAGIMAVPAGLTKEGFEIQFGTNYIGHAILLKLLLPKMLQAAELPDGGDARLIMLSSAGHKMAPPEGIKYDELKKSGAGTRWSRYGQSKLADILLAKAVAKRYPQILSTSVHPGLVRTKLAGRVEKSVYYYIMKVTRVVLPMYVDADEGSYGSLWAATAPKDKIENGTYYEPVGQKAGKPTATAGISELAGNEKLADKLWDWTENELKDLQAL